MKKRALTLLLALAMIVSLAACGGGGPAGSYKMTKMSAGGIDMNVEELASMMGLEMNVTLELKSDGNFSLDMSALGTGESVSGTWTSSGNTVTLTAEGEDISATLNGKTLVMEQDGESLTFEKQ